jgi:hypothetical protein
LSDQFEVKDSGERKQFESGMVRDTSAGKVNFLLVRPGPMLRRWAAHLTKAETKYPPPEIGVPNWTLANGPEELDRFRQSAARHFESWLDDEMDEDHAAGVIFNINGAEYVKEKLQSGLVYSPENEFEYDRGSGPGPCPDEPNAGCSICDGRRELGICT